MAFEIIRTKSGEAVDTHLYQVIFTIEDVDYRLDLRYNDRMERWCLDITTQAGDTVITGAVIVLGVDLFSYAVPALRPRGSMYAIWRQGTDAAPEPTERTLGQGQLLIYLERAEDLDPQPATEPPEL
jgi:hypothetical protein